MKTVVFTGAGEDLILEEKPIPSLEEGDVLVKVGLCGICTSDIMAQRGDASDYTPPVVLGHEIAGIITETRNNIFSVGQKVSVDPVMSCGVCYYCRHGLEKFCPEICGIGHDFDGGYAEYVRIPKKLADSGGLAIVPDDVPMEELVFLEPLATCLGAMREIPLGDNLVILGAGPIGLLFLQLAKRNGTRTIISEPLKDRRESAKLIGADDVIDPDTDDIVQIIRDLTDGIGADAVISATNNPVVIPDMFKILRRGGYANFFGLFPAGTEIKIDAEQLHFSGHKILASWAMTRKDTAEAQKEIAKRWMNLKSILTGFFPLDKPMEAINYVIKRKGLKAVFEP
jgi:L-iditol 2-dehydrogenase